MSMNDGKQQTAAVAQQRHKSETQHLSLAHDRRRLLIQSIRKHPCLYKNEFLRTPFMQRQEKQKLWDIVAEESGYEKTDEAKCKWRSLIIYLRQHLDSVAQRKPRRYVPNTGNPDDKYVQLNDWSFYKELEFIVPYVKHAASKPNHDNSYGNRISPTTNEMDIIIKSMENDSENADITKAVDANTIHNPGLVMILNNDDDTQGHILTEEEEILKEFFDNMLRSTLSLPRFHQTRVKKRLMHIINEQKEKK